jgi:signal transduction histidine kinase
MLNFQDFRALSYQILHYAHRGFLRVDFLREITKRIVDFSGCDAVVLHLKDRGKYYRCTFTPRAAPSFGIDITPYTENDATLPLFEDNPDLQRLYREVLFGAFDPASPFFTKNGSFWTNDIDDPKLIDTRAKDQFPAHSLGAGGECRSLALIPIAANGERHEKIGLLELRSTQKDFFRCDEIDFYEGVAEIISVALAHRRAQVRLRERVKELTCLYGIAQVAERPNVTLDQMLQSIVELLPPAWLHPDVAMARIIVDGHDYTTPRFQDRSPKQIAEIVVNGARRGIIEVVYTEERPELDEGPFLKEERSLIETIAKELALIIERKKAEEDKIKLEEQLRHADRLATIGQLAAGVAHELNEPLGSILGFAQLAGKNPKLPKEAEQDLEKIVASSLQAREIIKKLLIFARQMPPSKTLVSLNQIVNDGLYLLDTRLAKKGIELALLLAPSLPEITADPVQLHQVLVNLIVNALQAMPDGGRLTIQTRGSEDAVSLIVEDTGTGMSEEVLQKIFVPFFSTKDVGEGTGLGLAVVHGIVKAHGGFIKVESAPERGSRFEVQLPVTEAPLPDTI